jgi:hypothetical protein
MRPQATCVFINTELDRTDALLIVEESLATESVAIAQLAELASGTGIRAQEQHDGLATVEEKVVESSSLSLKTLITSTLFALFTLFTLFPQ